MTILRIASKVIRIEAFVASLTAVLIWMHVMELELFSWISFLILIVGSILFVLLDAWMARTRWEVSRTRSLQMSSIYILAGLILLGLPPSMQMTRLDSFEKVILILAIAFLVVNPILFVAVWIAPRDK